MLLAEINHLCGTDRFGKTDNAVVAGMHLKQQTGIFS